MLPLQFGVQYTECHISSLPFYPLDPAEIRAPARFLTLAAVQQRQERRIRFQVGLGKGDFGERVDPRV